MSTSKTPKQVAKLKAKAVSVSSPATDLQKRRAERAEVNAKLVQAPQAADAIKANAAKVAERIAKIQSDAEAEAKAKAAKTDDAKTDAALKQIPAGGLSEKLRKAIVTPQLPPPFPAAAYAQPTAKRLPSPSGIAPQTSDKSVVATQAPKANGTPKAPEVTELPPAQVLELPVRFLAAALTVAPSSEKRTYLNGVRIHQLPSGQLRIVATDGHRLLAISIEGAPRTDWAAAGITIATDQLQRIVRYLGKDAETVSVSFGVGHKAVTLSGDAVATFSAQPLETYGVPYPDYQRVMDQAVSAFTSQRVEMETSSLDPKYIKSAAAIAAVLGSKGIMPFIGGDSKLATVFTFADVPQALLYIMPQAAPQNCIEAPALRMLGSSASADIVAKLKEQAAASRKHAKTCKHKKFADLSIGRAERLEARALSIQAAISVKLEAPKPAPTAPAVQAPAVAAAVATAKAVTTASVH
jgi:hypothetical protein